MTKKERRNYKILGILNLFFDEIRDIEIVGCRCSVLEGDVYIHLRNTDWNHSFMITFIDDDIVIYHSSGLAINYIDYKMDDDYQSLARTMVDFVSNNIFFTNSESEQNFNLTYDDVRKNLSSHIDGNDDINDIISFIKENNMQVVSYSPRYLMQNLENGVHASCYRIEIYLLSEDWNVCYMIIMNRLSPKKYNCHIIANKLGDVFYSTKRFGFNEFEFISTRLNKQAYNNRQPIPSTAMDRDYMMNIIVDRLNAH